MGLFLSQISKISKFDLVRLSSKIFMFLNLNWLHSKIKCFKRTMSIVIQLIMNCYKVLKDTKIAIYTFWCIFKKNFDWPWLCSVILAIVFLIMMLSTHWNLLQIFSTFVCSVLNFIEFCKVKELQNSFKENLW